MARRPPSAQRQKRGDPSAAGQQLYPNADACLAACAAFPTDGDATATQGNSVQCRIYHSSFPAAADAMLHCPHASSNGGTVCGTACEGYCNQVLRNCDGYYSDSAACMNFCSVMQVSTDTATTSGDSVECRTYHASFPAAGDATLHCPHASINGGDVCGSYCDVYCNFEEAHCGFGMGANAQHADRASCLTACAAYATTGDPTATQGDTVQCRIYHSSFPASMDAALHCPHSGVDGAGVCVP